MPSTETSLTHIAGADLSFFMDHFILRSATNTVLHHGRTETAGSPLLAMLLLVC